MMIHRSAQDTDNLQPRLRFRCGEQRMTEERIMARRVTLEEFCDYMGKLEYIEGRIVTGRGIELFVGVKEFSESIRALEEERKRVLKNDGE